VPEALPFARFQATPQLAMREYDQHPLKPSIGRFAVASNASAGTRFEIDGNGIDFLRALSRPRTFAELVEVTGMEAAKVRQMLELATNRGFVRIFVDEQYVRWTEEALPLLDAV
jgi:hypothetical protein